MGLSGGVIDVLAASTIVVIFISPQCFSQQSQDYTYLGCFADDGRLEILPDLIFCNPTVDPYTLCENTCGPQGENYCNTHEMTVELCRDICADQIMKYFGLHAGSKCICGGEFAPYDEFGEATTAVSLMSSWTGGQTCGVACTGSSNQTCGGNDHVDVYSFHDPAYNADCFNPGYVLNGDQIPPYSSSYAIGDVIDFASACPSPNIMDGFNSITCSTSGNWTDRPPTCTVRCPMPVTPKHARFSTGQNLLESHAISDVITYECIHDATRANETMVCGYYGSWEAGKGKEQCPGACERNPCFGAATCDNNRIDPEIGYICYCPLGFEGQNCELQQSRVTTPLCGQNFYNRTGAITSPNYPNNYDNNNNCTYLIRVSRMESIHFTVHEFKSETGKDYLSYGEGYSVYPDPGSTPADYPMLSGYSLVKKNKTFDFEWDNIWLHWHTDSEYSQKGFNISYSTVVFDCSHSPCHNNATCIDVEDGTSICQCQLGWTGKRCKKSKT
nr:uncharacterized protein LOC129280935 [Lytechinus pictus]